MKTIQRRTKKKKSLLSTRTDDRTMFYDHNNTFPSTTDSQTRNTCDCEITLGFLYLLLMFFFF